MNESELRRQIESVRRGTLPRRRFVERLAAVGIGAPMAWLLLADAGVAQPSSAPPYKPTQARRRRAAARAALAGADAAEPALRHRHQGRARRAGLLRRARALRRRRRARADPRGGDSEPRERRRRCRRAVGRLEAQARRHLARRRALHRRRLRLQLAVRHRCRHRRHHARRLQRHAGRAHRFAYGAPRLRPADAVLAAHLLHHRADPQASVRRLPGRALARGAGEPQAGRHRAVPLRRLPAGRPGARRDQPELSPAEPALFRQHRGQGRRRRDVGGARGAADRRVRLRLEPAGRGRRAAAHGKRRQGAGASSRPAARSSSSSSPGTTRTRRSTASAAAPGRAIRSGTTRRCARR